MTTDKELLILAATAAGIEYDEFIQRSDFVWGRATLSPNGTFKLWNPLTSNDDAFMLVIKLKFLHKWDPESISSPEIDGFFDSDVYNAAALTRRAVVQYAAALEEILT